MNAPDFMLGHLATRCNLIYLHIDSDILDVSLVPKMARSPEEVLGFVQDLARRARPFAERELAELQEFARRDAFGERGFVG